MSPKIQQERIRILTPSLATLAGEGAVVYWMNRDRRVQDNWALLYAQHIALQRRVALNVVHCHTPNDLGASDRTDQFMLSALNVVAEQCVEHNISFELLFGDPRNVFTQWITEHQPSLIVTDFEPLRLTQQRLDAVVQLAPCPVHQVDAHNIVPCWTASPKQEFGAYTLRPKLTRLLPQFLDEFPSVVRHPFGIAHGAAIEKANGATHDGATSIIQAFVSRINTYVDRNDPTKLGQSNLSPYLHFGFIAPQRVAMVVSQLPQPTESGGPFASFLEELIIRRELSDNFTFYNSNYDTFEGFPNWARESLNEHRNDPRDYIYSYEDWEGASTHCPLWNAAQRELLGTGKMHGYMRMYWAKKLLEWSASPEEALAVGIALNDTYELDGRDPNGYAGLAWSIGGVHDRAWFGRPVYGKVRYMNANGCAKKFDVKEYIRRNETR